MATRGNDPRIPKRFRGVKGPASAENYGLINPTRLNQYYPGESIPVGAPDMPTADLVPLTPGQVPPAVDPAARGLAQPSQAETPAGATPPITGTTPAKPSTTTDLNMRMLGPGFPGAQSGSATTGAAPQRDGNAQGAYNYLTMPELREFSSIPQKVMEGTGSFIQNLFDTTDDEKEAVFGLERPWDATISALQWVDDRTNQAKSWAFSRYPGGIDNLSWEEADQIGPGQVAATDGASLVRELTERLGPAGTAIGVMLPVVGMSPMHLPGAIAAGISATQGSPTSPFVEEDFTIEDPKQRKAAFEESAVGKYASGIPQAATSFADPFAAAGWMGAVARVRYLDTPVFTVAQANQKASEFQRGLQIIDEEKAAGTALFTAGKDSDRVKRTLPPIARLAYEAVETGPDGNRVMTATALAKHRVLIDNHAGEAFGEALHSAQSMEEAGLILLHGLGIPDATAALAKYRPDILTSIRDAENEAIRLRLLWHPEKQERMADAEIAKLNIAERELKAAKEAGAPPEQLSYYQSQVNWLLQRAKAVWEHEVHPFGEGPFATPGEIAAKEAGFATKEARDEWFQTAIKQAEDEAARQTARLDLNRSITEPPAMAGQAVPGTVTETFGALQGARTGLSSDTMIGRAVAGSRTRRAKSAYEAQATRMNKFAVTDYFGNGPIKRASQIWRWASAEAPSGIVVTHGLERLDNGVREVIAMFNDLRMYAGAPKVVTRNGKRVEIGGVARKEALISQYRQAVLREGPEGEQAARDLLLHLTDQIGKDIAAWHGLDESKMDTIFSIQMEEIEKLKDQIISTGYWYEDGKKIHSPFLKSHLQQSMLMPNWREFERAAARFSREPGAISDMAGAGKDTLIRYYDAFNEYWRPAVLLRFGYPQRNVLEGAGRASIFLGSLDPYKWVAQGAFGTGPANAVRRAVQRRAVRALPKDPKFERMPARFTKWHGRQVEYVTKQRDDAVAVSQSIEETLLDSPAFRSELEAELAAEATALAKANSELRANTIIVEAMEDTEARMLAQYPNLNSYRDGGSGGVGESRSVVGLVRTDALRLMHGNRRDAAHLERLGEWDRAKVTDPLMVVFDPSNGRMYLGEGNHRLELAAAAGEEYVPVRMERGRIDDMDARLQSEIQGGTVASVVVPPSPWKGGRGEDYWPPEMHPSYWLDNLTVKPGENAVPRYAVDPAVMDDIERNIDRMAEIQARRNEIAERNAADEARKAAVEAKMKAPKATVYLRPSQLVDVKPYKDKPGRSWGRNPKTNERVILISHDELPDTLYHVTTNRPAVEADGVLRAFKGGDKAGLGGSHDGVVSLTVTRETAEQLRDDLILYTRLRDADTIQSATRMLADEAERIGMDPTQVLEYGDLYAAMGGNTLDSINTMASLFWNMRQTRGLGPNPLIFGGIGQKNSPWLSVRAEDIDIIEVPKGSVSREAVIEDFDVDLGGGLNEVRVHGDVPVQAPVTIDQLTPEEVDDLLVFTAEEPAALAVQRENLKYMRQQVTLHEEQLKALNDPVTASSLYREQGASVRRRFDGVANTPDTYAFRATQVNDLQGPRVSEAFDPESNFSQIALALSSSDTTNRMTAALRSDVYHNFLRAKTMKYYVEVKPGEAGYWDGYATMLRQFQFSDVGNFLIHGKTDEEIVNWLRGTREGRETAAFITRGGKMEDAKPYAQRLVKAQRAAEERYANVKAKVSQAETEAAEAKEMVRRARKDFAQRQKESKRPLKRHTDPETGRNWNSVESMDDWLTRKQEAVLTAQRKWDDVMARVEEETWADLPHVFHIMTREDALQYVMRMRQRLEQLTHGDESVVSLLRSTSLPVDEAGRRGIVHELRKGDKTGVAGDMLRSMLDRVDPATGMPVYNLQPVVGNAAQDLGYKTIRKAWGDFVSAAFKWVGTQPEDFFVRNPFYGKRHAQALEWQFRSLQDHLKPGESISFYDINRIERNAHLRALKDTKQYLYTMDRRTTFGRFWENFMPFVSATQNAVTVAGRLAYMRPAAVPFVIHAYQAPGTVGLVDEEGRVVIPIPHALLPDGLEKWAGIDNQQAWRFNLDSFNLLLPMSQSLGPVPQLGPWIGVPANELMKNNLFGASPNPPEWFTNIVGPEVANGAWNFAMDLIYGDSAPSKQPGSWDQLLPPWVREGVYRILGQGSSAAYDLEWQNQWQAELLKFQSGLRDDPPDPEEINNRTNGNQIVKVFQRLFLPFIPQNQGVMDPLQDAIRGVEQHVRENPSLYVAPDGTQKEPSDVVRELFGDTLAAAGNTSITTPVGGLMSNSVSVDIAQKHGPMIARVAPYLEKQNQLNVLGMMAIGTEDAEYSDTARAWQMNNQIPGTTRNWYESKSPMESALDATTSQGWAAWSAFDQAQKAEMAQLGITGYRSGSAAVFRERRDRWVEQARTNPSFDGWYDDYMVNDSARNTQSIRLLTTLTADRGWMEANKDSEVWRDGGIATSYLAVRDYVIDELARRKAMNPKVYGGIDDRDNQDLRDYWDQSRMVWEQQSPDWSLLVSRYLQGDDNPEVPSVVYTPPEQQYVSQPETAGMGMGSGFVEDAVGMGVG